jgi:ABC-type polysaccharide/polyol phosphate export permease
MLFCYIVYHYCLKFDRGVVHVGVVILYTITVLGSTEEWLMLFLLYCLPLLFKFWQRSGSWFGCYFIYHYSLRFDRGMVHVVVVGYIIYHYFLRFDRGVVHVVVILSTITVLGLTEEWFMLLLLYWLALLFKVWQRSGSCFCCCYID